jgi:exodeoxyribonuclease V beta subunit
VNQVLRYLRPAELSGLGRRNAVVESSAGTGKTFLLEHLFVDLILSHGIPCDEILVVTFTEKATAELVLRLRGLLERLAHLRADDPMALAARDADPGSVWTIDEPARARLAQSLLGFDRASISTIHGFCQRILQDHAFVQARFFDEEVVAKEAAFGGAFRDVLRTHATDDELGSALSAWLASGRTVAALEQLVRACDHEQSAPLFPRFDAERLRLALASWQRVSDSSELRRCLKQARVHGSTINGILRRTERISELVATTSGEGIPLLVGFDRFRAERGTKDTFSYLLTSLPVVAVASEGCLATLAEAVRMLATAVVPLEALIAARMLPLVREQAASHKRRAGWFEFSDMLALVAKALADPGPAGRALMDALRRQYRHALIDEFQDTDEIQWSIFRRIFTGGPTTHALTVIGDPKQAIYGFRGADVHAYLDARHALVEQGAARVVLDRNFRSTKDMVAATNLIFDERAEFFRSGSGIRYDDPVRCGRADLALDQDATHGGKPVVVLDVRSDETKLKSTDAAAAVRAAIVDEIGSLLRAENPLRLRSAGEERKIFARNIFVLTFTNAESRAIGMALREAGIAHAFYKLGNLFESAEAEEILTLLRAIAEPDRRGLRAQAFLTRFFDMDVTAAAAALELGTEAPASRLLFRFASLARSGDIPELFTAILDESGVVRRELFAQNDERTITNVTHVLEILQGHWARKRASLPELVDLLAAYISGSETLAAQEGDLQRLETDKDAVQILTVHKAKGLEADVVFLYGGITDVRRNIVHVVHEHGERTLHVGRLDENRRRLVEQELADEHARLLYVALTRARFRMVLPHYPAAVPVRGPYRQANRRLDALRDDEGARELFAKHDVAAPLPKNTTATISASAAGTPPELPAANEPEDIAAIRAARSGFMVTSYSAIKRARSVVFPHARPDEERHEALDEALDEALHEALDEGLHVRIDNTERADAATATERPVLPGGAETGIFLHDLLATAVLDELSPELGPWLARPSVERWLDKIRRRNARPEVDVEPAARLVHRAYTSPVALGNITMPNLASADTVLREMEFLFPIPEAAHPLLSQPLAPSACWTIGRGAVRGFIDFLFEHEGRVVVCDWKSDDLVDFSPGALAEHCREHYAVQARLYILATLRLSRITGAENYAKRFGGMLFCFLRGLPDPPSPKGGLPASELGMHFFKPAWSEILDWERGLQSPGFWEGVR